jgi:hypothetical protein
MLAGDTQPPSLERGQSRNYSKKDACCGGAEGIEAEAPLSDEAQL